MRTEIEEEVLERVKPDEDERKEIIQAASDLKDEITEIAGEDLTPILVGSVAKGTFTKKPDIDMFVLFPLEYSKEKMAEIGLEIGEELLENTVKKYAEHPYTYGTYKGYDADIVPCYTLDSIEAMKSSVDRTPLHTEYIKANLHEDKKDDVILLKSFLKGIGAYSAESRVRGFSGYLCELLVIHYGGFREVLESGRGWKKGHRIELVESDGKFDEPLVVIDPVDPARNVASALSGYNLFLFVYAAKQYLEDTKIEFFFPDEVKSRTDEQLKELWKSRGTYIIALQFKKPDVVEDNLYPQVQKAERNLVKQMEENDFDLFHSDYFVLDDSVIIVMELNEGQLCQIEKHMGPPVWHSHSVNFSKKYGDDIYIENGRLMVDRARKNPTAVDVIDETVKNIDMGSDINPILKVKMKILENERLIEKHPSSVNKFFERRFPWER